LTVITDYELDRQQFNMSTAYPKHHRRSF